MNTHWISMFNKKSDSDTRYLICSSGLGDLQQSLSITPSVSCTTCRKEADPHFSGSLSIIFLQIVMYDCLFFRFTGSDSASWKHNPKSLHFAHRITRKAVWVDGWSNPMWLRRCSSWLIKLMLAITRGSQNTAPPVSTNMHHVFCRSKWLLL